MWGGPYPELEPGGTLAQAPQPCWGYRVRDPGGLARCKSKSAGRRPGRQAPELTPYTGMDERRWDAGTPRKLMDSRPDSQVNYPSATT